MHQVEENLCNSFLQQILSKKTVEKFMKPKKYYKNRTKKKTEHNEGTKANFFFSAAESSRCVHAHKQLRVHEKKKSKKIVCKFCTNFAQQK